MAEPHEHKRPGRRPRARHAAMTRRELAQKLQEKLGMRHSTDEMLVCVEAMIDSMTEAMLEGRPIEFRDFGVFQIVERKARVGRNPKRPQDVFMIPSRKVIKFKVARKLMEKMSAAPRPARESGKR